MHLMLRIGREMNAEHPRRKKCLVDVSQSILSQHEDDRDKLEEVMSGCWPTNQTREGTSTLVGDPESFSLMK